MYCGNCGAQLPDGTAVCTACGAAQNADAQAAPQAAPQAAATTGEPKSKMTAGLLAIFLGSIGIHSYYLGDMARFKKLLILGLCGLVTCGITAIVSEVMGIIDGINIFTGKITTDANGVPFKD